MHQSSYQILTKFEELLEKHSQGRKIRILDVGSYGVNGTYKDIFADSERYDYTGLDLEAGPNVDYVPDDPYKWSGLEDGAYDAVISGQVFEHVEFPWLTIAEMKKKLKTNGLMCIVAPSRGPEHRYPADCWRYYPDGFRALAKWAELEVLDVKTFWGATGFDDGSDQWGDTYCVLQKRVSSAAKEPVAARPANRNNPLSAAKRGSYYAFARGEAVEAVTGNSLAARRVLEIGCSTGATGKKFKEAMEVDHYVGVDISEEAAAIAKTSLDRVITADIEKVDLQSEYGIAHEDYDLLLALDVLEHLNDPWDALAGLSKHLKPGGHVIASIPNVQNVTVLQDLARGTWKYQDAGILDATHLRFFTYESSLEMFAGAGFSVVKVEQIINPKPDLSALKETGNSIQLENMSLNNLSREEVIRFFTYQYLVIARKDPEAGGEEELEEGAAAEAGEGRDSAAKAEPFIGEDFTKGLVSIVIPTFNQYRFTEQCIESIRKHTPEPVEIVFVDNGSKDGTPKRLRQLVKANENYHLVANKKNLGFAKACNQGISAASGEHILLLNNDVLVTEGWLSGLLGHLESDPDAGIVGPMTNSISGPQKVVDDGYDPANLDAYARDFREANRHRRVPARRIVGFCMLFRRELVQKIGLLDETFGSGNYEDDDYCLRASLEGYRNLIAGDVFIHHFGSQSFIGNNIDHGAMMARNKKIYRDKWGGADWPEALKKRLVTVNALLKAGEYSQMGLLEKAVEAFIEGAKHSPEDRAVYRAFAEMLIENKRFKDALDVLKTVPGGLDGDAKGLVLAGCCRDGLELFSEAEECADKALEAEPGSARALNLKGMAILRREGAPAEELFLRAIEADPGDGEAYANLGVLKWSTGQREEALGLFETAFVLCPGCADIAGNYQAAAIELSDLERATGRVADAVALHPLNKRLKYLLIEFLGRRGAHAEALSHAEEALIAFGMDDDGLGAALELREKVGAKEIGGAAKGTVSLCMIVLNEESHIARCLSSAGPVADEIIVVDTGSEDRTREIARAFGAKVYDHPWNDDFSEARNVALSKASGDWVLILDADEVLGRSDLARLKDLAGSEGRAAYALTTRNYIGNMQTLGWRANDGAYPEEAGTGWVPSTKVRLFPNDKRVRFENPVHELVEASLARAGIPVKDAKVPVHHYGKLVKKQTLSKGEDYFLLGKKKLDEQGGGENAIFELAVQAEELKKYEDAATLWGRLVALKPDSSRAFYGLGNASFSLGRYDDALAAVKKARKLSAPSREVSQLYVLCELFAGKVEKALPVAEDLVGKDPDYPVAVCQLIAALCCAGRARETAEYFEKLGRTRFNTAGYAYELASRLFDLGNLAFAAAILEAVVDNGILDEKIPVLLSRCYKSMVKSGGRGGR